MRHLHSYTSSRQRFGCALFLVVLCSPLPCASFVVSPRPHVDIESDVVTHWERQRVGLHRKPAPTAEPTPPLIYRVQQHDYRGFLDVFLGLVFVLFALFIFGDMHEFLNLLTRADCLKDGADLSSAADEAKDVQHWTVLGLVALTSYRFFTGFLSATWLPYLLAMEGEDLWANKQSMFMGVAKLIYGLTILLNPVFGRIGDQACRLSHGLGRRIFVRVGVSVAAMGIFMCIWAAHLHSLPCFLFGIMVWRLGEALNDVTTEALVPEMVVRDQFLLAGSVKAASFLCGGLFGYVLIIIFAGWHYSWLYYAYLIGMLTCSIPSIILLGTSTGVCGSTVPAEAFWTSVVQSYVGPISYPGSFPRFCMATFIFTLGTAPMFFLLLIVRDLVGVDDPMEIQTQFGWMSIIVFVSAAGAAILSGVSAKQSADKAADDQVSEEVRAAEAKEFRARRWRYLVYTQVCFGLIILLLPTCVLLSTVGARIKFFYVISVFFGGCFGSGYARFQDATWQVLPVDDKGRANAMGFNTMCRLLGVGIGNFVAGMILDFYENPRAAPAHYAANDGWSPYDEPAKLGGLALLGLRREQVYQLNGYLIMCVLCFFANICSAWITRSIAQQEMQDEDRACTAMSSS